jgi:hypothetical protein
MSLSILIFRLFPSANDGNNRHYGDQQNPTAFSKTITITEIFQENNITETGLIGFGDVHTETKLII